MKIRNNIINLDREVIILTFFHLENYIPSKQLMHQLSVAVKTIKQSNKSFRNNEQEFSETENFQHILDKQIFYR